MTEAIEPVPSEPLVDPGHMWTDERIWGHRLWDGQSPWLIFLEFMSIAEACHHEGRLFEEGDPPFSLRFRPEKRLQLRNILYNNEIAAEIARRTSDDAAAWAEWLQWMRENAQGLENRDFSYLRTRFRSFAKFAALVAMIRSTTIESGSNRRWSSRFVFPFGRNAIYEDLGVRNEKVTREYINFGRTGELLYQMIVRSRHADPLRRHFGRILDRRDPCDRLLELMQPTGFDDRQPRGGGSHLPYARHPAFDDLAIDWVAVLDLGMPRFDAYPHLATLAAFHLSDYQLRVAARACGKERPVYVCEVVAPRRTLVRELSVTNYLNNEQLPQAAVERLVANVARRGDWQEAANDPDGFSACLAILREEVNWPVRDDDYDGPMEADALLAALRKAAVARHRQHVANVHRSFGGGAGLVSRRGTTRLRYAPTDDFLKALIFANVPGRMEYGEFLSVLRSRYGLVFGDREAKEALGDDEFDRRAFQSNSERLEGRLRTLGMLRRLSDACAYVENPLRGTVVA